MDKLDWGTYELPQPPNSKRVPLDYFSNAQSLIDTKNGKHMTLMEWLQDTLDFNTIEHLGIMGETPYVTIHKEKENECQGLMTLMLKQAQAQLTTDSFYEVTSPRTTQSLANPKTNALEREVSPRFGTVQVPQPKDRPKQNEEGPTMDQTGKAQGKVTHTQTTPAGQTHTQTPLEKQAGEPSPSGNPPGQRQRSGRGRGRGGRAGGRGVMGHGDGQRSHSSATSNSLPMTWNETRPIILRNNTQNPRPGYTIASDRTEQEKAERRMKAQRMNGLDINNLVEEGQEVSKTSGTKARRYGGIERRDFNIRMRLPIKTLHDEQCRYDKLREWYSVLYRANNSVVIYQQGDGEDSQQLESPDRFPGTYADCQHFFADMRAHNNNFCWVVRVSATGTYKELRDDLFSWNSKNRGFVTFDDIQARRVSRLGWFQHFHLDLHNPREFKKYLDDKLQSMGHSLKYDLFKQKVVSNARTNKEISRALILDVDVLQRKIATDLLLAIQFDGKYSKVRFHPFVKTRQFPEHTLRRLIKVHREYMDRTLKLTVHGTKNVNAPILLKNNTTTTLSDMFLSTEINQEGFIHSTSMQFGELNILYDSKHSAHMIEWKNRSVEKIKTRLTQEAQDLVFTTSTEQPRPQRYDNNSNRLRSYAAAVNRQYGNPQDNNLPQTQEAETLPNPNDGDAPETTTANPGQNPLVQEKQEKLDKLQSQIDTMSNHVDSLSRIVSNDSSQQTSHPSEGVTEDRVNHIINEKMEQHKAALEKTLGDHKEKIEGKLSAEIAAAHKALLDQQGAANRTLSRENEERATKQADLLKNLFQSFAKQFSTQQQQEQRNSETGSGDEPTITVSEPDTDLPHEEPPPPAPDPEEGSTLNRSTNSQDKPSNSEDPPCEGKL